MRTYCTRNGSCVGSDIGWSVSIPIQELTVNCNCNCNCKCNCNLDTQTRGAREDIQYMHKIILEERGREFKQ